MRLFKKSKPIYIFVGGAARTGTTLMQAILCSDKTTNPLISESAPIRLLLESLEKNIRLYKRFPGMYFNSEEELKLLYSNYLDIFFAHLKKKYSCQNLVLKEPQLTKYFPLLFELLNDKVKFVCMVRDPKDTIASMLTWGEKMREQGQEHFFQNRNMEELTYFYKSFYAPLFRYEKENTAFKKKILYIRYEELVLNHEEIVSKLRDFLGLSLSEFTPNKVWIKSKINFNDNNLPFKSAITELYGKKISSSGIGKFKKILTEEEINIIENNLSPFLNRFNYQPMHYDK